jgi:hypothetical protein
MSIKKQYPESLKKFTARMMESLKGAYSNFRPNDNPDQLRVYAEAMERMVDDFGQGRTAAAIAKAIDYIPDFVPTIAKIREFVPAREGELKTCSLCHPSGYVMVYSGRTDGGNKVDPQFGAAKRCDHAGGMSPVVDPHEGDGYGGDDIKALQKMHRVKRAALGRPLTQSEQDALLNDLDRRRQRVRETA